MPKMKSKLKTFKVGYSKNVGYKKHGSRTVKARDANEAKVRVRHIVDGAFGLYIQAPQA